MIIYGYHILVFITVLSPLWAYLIWHLNTNHKSWYLIGSLALYGGTLLFSWHPVHIPKVTFWLQYYGLFAIIYVFLIGLKFNFTRFNKALALAIMMLFVAGDLWEIPNFIYDLAFNHTFHPPLMWSYSHIRRLYTLATFVLFTMLSGFKFNRFNLAILGIATIWTFVLLLPGAEAFPMRDEIIRMFYLMAFGLFGYIGIENRVLV